jgi:hypothetical protein
MDHGVLEHGEDVRHLFRRPTKVELLVGTAKFVFDELDQPARRRGIEDADEALRHGARIVTKVALFPVRFLYLLETGKLGENDAAACHYLATRGATAESELVAAARRWRHAWSEDDVPRARRLLEESAIPLYREFARAYVEALDRAGEDALAARLARWADELGEGCGFASVTRRRQ